MVLYAAKQDLEQMHRRRWATLLVLCISLLVIIIDNSILNVAIPTLARPTDQGGLGASASELQWIVDMYTIVFAGLLLTAGSLGDRFGRYRFLTFGLVVFGVGSGLSAFAGSPAMLIATRALMGFGGAFIMPSTLSVLTNVFQVPGERAKAIGIWAGISALGIAIGPLTGGFLLEHFWWGSVFVVNLPIVAVGLVAGYILVPESKDPAAPRLDPVGAGLSIAGLIAVLWGIIEAPAKGWGSGPVLTAFVVGAVILAAFFVWELRCESPMLDMAFFKNPRFTAASGAITLTFFALFGTIFLLTQYLQAVLGFSTVKAGAVFVPQALIMLVLAPLSSVWVRRLGSKVVVTGGLVLVATAMTLLTTLQTNSSWFHVVAISITLGIGMANVMAPATESIMGSLPRAKAGVGSAVNDTTRQVGGALGVAVLGSIMSSRYSHEVTSSLDGRVPVEAVGAVKDNIGEAVGFAQHAPVAQPFAGTLIDVARDSFVTGMHTSVLVAAGVALLAAVGVAIWLPARATDEAERMLITIGGDHPRSGTEFGDGDGAAKERVRPQPAKR